VPSQNRATAVLSAGFSIHSSPLISAERGGGRQEIDSSSWVLSSQPDLHTVNRVYHKVVDPNVADPDPFDTDPDHALNLDMDTDPANQFDTDPDPYRFKEVMNLKQYFLYIFYLIFLVSKSKRTQTKGIL
jgi:hypothetical protein